VLTGYSLGCLLGGAVGDALGAPIEFMNLSQIRAIFGPSGLADYVEAYGKRSAITDDTQMVLFTAEGLLRAFNRGEERGICYPPSVVHHAHTRWLLTQGGKSTYQSYYQFLEFPNGWLIKIQQLHSRRAPGRSCLSALMSDRMGTIEEGGSREIYLVPFYEGDAIPPKWIGDLELREVIGEISRDLATKYKEDDPSWWRSIQTGRLVYITILISIIGDRHDG
jgi:hypothetical protein